MLQEGHMYWHGHVEACGSGLLWSGLNFSTVGMVYYVTEHCRKNWKDVLMQNVITLNNCCNTACPTFQLPHITTGSFQNHRRQLTTGSFQSLQRLKERNKLSVKWKTFAIHKLVCWYFRVEWVSGLKGRPYSITERRVPELIPLLGSQPTGNVSHKPGSRLPLLWAKPAVTPQLLRGLLPILLFGEQRHNGCKQFT